MEETIRKLDNIFLFMFGLGLAGACVGLTAFCVCGRAEKFWESFTLGSAVVCVCGFLLRSITAAEKTDSEKGERCRRRAEAEGEYKAFCRENRLGDRWVDCGDRRIWLTGDVLMIAENREKYLERRERFDGEITFETIRFSDLSYFDRERGGNTVIRYHDGSIIKYLDFEGSAVYDFLLKILPEKVRKE